MLLVEFGTDGVEPGAAFVARFGQQVKAVARAGTTAQRLAVVAARLAEPAAAGFTPSAGNFTRTGERPRTQPST
ncbi:hypothetical protein [Streptomyces sp. NPDC048481]|uniref:hypothetical protein n=1 Tax=Streptomyces sp. NPDC048481 TaxID=3365557 RepID=UPI003721C0A5